MAYKIGDNQFADVSKKDLISRHDTIEYLVDNMTWYDEDGCESDEDEKRYIIEGLINGVPPAQPWKMGHWIVNVEEENTISGHCSACGWQAHLYEDDVVGMNFCPNCGSKMEVKND